MSGSPTKFIISKVEWSVPRRAFDTSKESISSKKFRAGADHGANYHLELYPRGDGVTDEDDDDRDSHTDYVCIYVVVDPEEQMTDYVRVRSRIGFITSDGAEKNVDVSDAWVYKNKRSDYYGWGTKSKFIRRDELLDPTKNFLWDDQVTIFCDLKVDWDTEVKVPESSLSQDLSRMLIRPDFSDVILVVGGEEIKAHKVVLAAGSEVFKEMFKYGMKGGRIPIKDLDVVGVRGMLNFFYSGEVKDLKAIVEKVLPAANKFKVERLKAMCERELVDKLTVENVGEMLLLAAHHSEKLWANVLALISSNPAEVVEQPSFWELADVNRHVFKTAVRFLTVRSNKSSYGKRVKITTDLPDSE